MFLRRFFNFVPKNEYSRALDLFNDGYYVKALRVFEQLLKGRENGDGVDMGTVELFACESHVALSRECMNEGNLDAAVSAMEKAVELKPHFADLRYNLGSLYMDARRHADARDNFERALGINPKFFKAAVNLARALFAAGQKDDAVAALESAKSNCPNFYASNLQDLTQMIRVGQDEQSVQPAFHEILEEQPSSAQISREVAVEAIQNGNYPEAIRELKKAIAIKPDYPDLHNYIGIAYGNSGMTDDSIEEFEVALKINPYYLKARLNLALALYDCGRYVEAQTHIDRVLQVQPENQLAHNLMAELKAVTGNR